MFKRKSIYGFPQSVSGADGKPSKVKGPATKSHLMFELVEPRVLLSADLLGLAGLPGTDLGDDQAPWEIDGVDASNLLADLDGAQGRAAAGDRAEPLPEPVLQALTDLSDPEEPDDQASLTDPLGWPGLDLAGFDTPETPSELLIIDPRVPDYQELIQGILDGRGGNELQIFVLDPQRDGIAQISELLDGRQDVAAIHLVSHGNDDGLQLGSTWLSGDNLDEYSERARRLGRGTERRCRSAAVRLRHRRRQRRSGPGRSDRPS